MEHVEHGQKGYRKKCRCEICRAANAAYQRDYQARRKMKASQGGASEAQPK